MPYRFLLNSIRCFLIAVDRFYIIFIAVYILNLEGATLLINRYYNLKKDTQYLKLLLANTISGFGSSIDNIAFSWLTYQITESSVWVAIIFGCSYLPSIFLQPLSGAFVERFSKKKILMFSDGLGIFVTGFMALLYSFDLLNPWILLIFAFLNSAVESIRIPAGVAIVPKILSKENYAAGSGLSHSLSEIASLVGLGITGLIIINFGVSAALIIDCITFFLSFILVFTLKYQEEIEFSSNPFDYRFYKKSLDEGIQYLLSNKMMKFICVFAVIINFTSVILGSYLQIYVLEYLKMDVDMYSFISASISLGMLLGAIIAPQIVEKISIVKFAKIHLLIVGLFYIFIISLTAADSELFITQAAIMLFFLFGLLNGVIGVKISISFLEFVKEEFLARVSATFNSLVTLAMPLSSLLLMTLSFQFEVDFIFIIYGTLNIIFSIVFLFIQHMTEHE